MKDTDVARLIAAEEQRQREVIQRWKPWQQATGPTSAAGKATAARNAYTGGHTVSLRRLIVELNRLLSEQAKGLADAPTDAQQRQRRGP